MRGAGGERGWAPRERGYWKIEERESERLLLELLLVLLVQEGLVDMGDDAAASDGGLDERVELFVAADRELQVAGRDALHTQVLGGVASQLQNLGSEVFQDRRSVDRGRGTHATVGVDAGFQLAVDAAHWELRRGLCIRHTWSPARADRD